ncbi:MAG: FAD-dependent oxidoreductase [Planctomycetota bacterium]|nr:FAD-dependent oxidoreductase [Planctomycetota bacterium]
MAAAIDEPARETDVLVVGGGPAGVGAAFAAARQGAKVLIVEQFNCLGGVATAGGHAQMTIFNAWGDSTRVVGGIPYEIAQRIEREGFGQLRGGAVFFEIEPLKFLYERMARELGVETLYHTFFCEALVENGAVAGVAVQNKSGRRILRAKRVVDCTGDGDVGASAGAPVEIGRPGDGRCQPVTLMFTIGGVNWDCVSRWRKDYKMKEVWARAQRNGDMEPFQDQVMGFWWTPTRPDQVGVNFTHVIGVDATRAEDLTWATIEARRQAFHSLDVFRKYVPGMERAYMVSIPHTLGLRESRRLMGEVVLTEQDMLARREWPDTIGYGSFFIDIHNLDGPGMAESTVRPEPGFRYQIPYRILVPRGVENLLCAGRCVSVTHVALGSIRVMVQCMLSGQAAGAAAALSLREGVSPRNLPVQPLQAALRAGQALLSEEDIARANSRSAFSVA